jgi:bifunctional DNA-binding transcriptional regulator/antitoxin component of YhaV-PrlF toxin-antitoxin module
VNQSGALTLPKDVRERGGIPDGGSMRIRVTPGGVLLTPVAAQPVEIYTPERIAEFLLNNAIDASDYEKALGEVRGLGLDSSRIPHEPIRRPKA